MQKIILGISVFFFLLCQPMQSVAACKEDFETAMNIDGPGAIEVPFGTPTMYGNYLSYAFQRHLNDLEKSGFPVDKLLTQKDAWGPDMKQLSFTAGLGPIADLGNKLVNLILKANLPEWQYREAYLEHVRLSFINKDQQVIRFSLDPSTNRLNYLSHDVTKWPFGAHEDGGWLGVVHTLTPCLPAYLDPEECNRVYGTLWNSALDDTRNSGELHNLVEARVGTHSLFLTGSERGAFIVGLRRAAGMPILMNSSGQNPLLGAVHSASEYFLERGDLSPGLERWQNSPFTYRLLLDIRFRTAPKH